MQSAVYIKYAPAYQAATITAFAAFRRIFAEIPALRDADEIRARVAGLIFRVIPVERVAILLAGHDQDRFVSSTYRRIGSQNGDPFPVDEATAIEALRKDGPIHGEKVICYPMMALDTNVGVIYAVMASGGFEYDRPVCELASGGGACAAGAG